MFTLSTYSLESLVYNTLHELLYRGVDNFSREGSVLQLGPVHLQLRDITNCGFDTSECENSTYSKQLRLMESCLYFLKENQVKYMPKYATYTRPDNKAYCNAMYGQYIADEIPKIISKLKKYKETRQAVLYIGNNGLILSKDVIDVPCTLIIQFEINPITHKLDCEVVMRSNDLRLGTLYDIPAACNLQQVIANSLAIDYGDYNHIVLNMHIYRKDINYMAKWVEKVKSEKYQTKMNYDQYLEFAKEVIYAKKG